ncbi:lipase family protein [Nocardia sp. alder85J]|uniref:lipase family protein n=1 Tax=Nocardia sp. alder85J TaxID=2862949 RepID=UPI001CD58D94|nr:lipase family protein [Nocardia sp. alder85J]MCX4098572.1 lipase family protein [Nocardia sp. alder85J]
MLPSSSGDPMFDAWPGNLADLAPGDLIDSRDVTAGVSTLMTTPIRQALLLKFRSTSAAGAPSFGTATLIVPAAAWTGPGSRPVQVNTLPINALGVKCTPGYAMSRGRPDSEVNTFLPTIWTALDQGFAVLLPDHEGPRMSYAEPKVAGHVVLDSIRAVRSTLPDEFHDSRYATAGYSGGAIAAYAAAMMVNEYAPELSGALVGTAAGGLVTDYSTVAHRLNGNIASGILLAVTLAMAREHPDILDYMNHFAQWLATSPLKDICGEADGPLGAVGIPVEVAADIDHTLDSGIADEIYRQTELTDQTSADPLFIYHGAHDIWIPYESAQQMFRQQCERGVPAIFRTDPGEHIIAMLTGFTEATDWLGRRLRGEPAPDECPTPH